MTSGNSISPSFDNVMPQLAKALASQHITIYCIDAETGAYKEFASTADYKYLDIPSQGDDFFNESRKNIARVIHPDDIEGDGSHAS